MKILIVADEECSALWEYYTPGKLREYDLILSGGDLKGDYLSFLVTAARCPLMYVHGNHDDKYAENPPEGCDCIDDKLVIFKGLRILGLGGSRRYSRGNHQYTEEEMEKRIRKLKRAIQLAGGVDIVLTHSSPKGIGDAEDYAHQGFASLLKLIDTYHPAYFLHGHMHLNYATGLERMEDYHGTKVINCCERYVLDWENPPVVQLSDQFYPKLCRKLTKNLEIVKYF